jgi:segregation and condensation protein B
MANIANEIEAILFVADRPVTLERLAELTKAPETLVVWSMRQLTNWRYHKYAGLVLDHNELGWFFRVSDSCVDIVKAYREDPRTLSDEANEVLSLIAYTQPVSLDEIFERVERDTAHVIDTLLNAGLVTKVCVGNTQRFATTAKFLEAAGLESLDDLPPIFPEDLEQAA